MRMSLGSRSRGAGPAFRQSIQLSGHPARMKKTFLDDFSNSGRPFDAIVKVGKPARPRRYREKTVTGKGEIMTQYLVAIHHPDGYDGSLGALRS
jgi:hypothetical protein